MTKSIDEIKGKLVIVKEEHPEVFKHLLRFKSHNRMSEVRSLLSLALMVKKMGLQSYQGGVGSSFIEDERKEGGEGKIEQRGVKTGTEKESSESKIPIFDDLDEELLGSDFGDLT